MRNNYFQKTPKGMRLCVDKIIRKCKINLHNKKGGVEETYKSMKLNY